MQKEREEGGERHNPPRVTVNKREDEKCTVKLRREIEEQREREDA